jgi:heptosyltransferase I
MRILIIKGSTFDELVNALPVLDYLKQAAPEIEIDWAVEEPLQPLLEGNPHLSLLHTLRPAAWRRQPFASSTRHELALLRETLQERAYDLVFDLQGDLKSGLIGKLTGCADRIGFEKDEVKESLNTLFTSRRIPMRRQDSHLMDKYLRLVSVPFAKDFRQMELSATVATSPEEDAGAAALLATLSDGLVFLFHCGSSWQTRLWSNMGWIRLGSEMLERFPDSTIIFPWGDAAEKATVAEIAAGIGRNARVIEQHTLKELTALLKKVDLVVGVDAGPLHLAAALGTPTVSLYRATDGKRVGPRGEQHVVIQSPMHCARCQRKNCDKDLQCRDTVKVEAVLAGVEKLLALPS